MFFTFDPLKKAELELRFANEDALAIRRLYDKGKYELAEKYYDEFQERFQRAIQRTERTQQKGKDVKALIEKLKKNHLRQQQILASVLEKAPEQAKEGVLKAIESSGVGLENTVKKIPGGHKMEQFREKLDFQIRNMDKETQLRIQKRLESKRRQPELKQIPEFGVKCPDGICDEYELKEGLCPEDCKGVEGWEKKEQSEGKEGMPEIRTSEDVPNYQKKEGPNNEEKQTVNRLEGEPFCGDGICNDELYLSEPETPENCPQDCVAITREEDFEENYNNIMAEMKDIIPDVPEEEKQPVLVRKKEKILVEERISGEIFLSLRGKHLNYIPLPERPKKIIEAKIPALAAKSSWKPPANHPWRRFILNPERKQTRSSV